MSPETRSSGARIDSLVRGSAGVTHRVVEGRVYSTPVFGVAIVDADGRQWVLYDGRFEVVEDPRPIAQRRDIPDRLQ